MPKLPPSDEPTDYTELLTHLITQMDQLATISLKTSEAMAKIADSLETLSKSRTKPSLTQG